MHNHRVAAWLPDRNVDRFANEFAQSLCWRCALAECMDGRGDSGRTVNSASMWR